MMKTNLLKTKVLVIVALAGIVLASCGKKDTTENNQEVRVPAKVEIAELKEYPVVHSFSGRLEAEKQSNLSTRIMGQISRIYVKPGQKVKKGDLLIQIRNQDILAKKAQVEASKIEATTAYESAKKDYERFKALYESKSASAKELDDVTTHFKMAEARVNAVKQMEKEVEETMRYASIRAPYSGVITSKFVQEGDMANPGMPLLSMESPSKWKVVARIPEADIARLQLNDAVEVRFNTDETIDGVIAEINPSATNTGNQFEAKVILSDSEPASLYSGMHATVLYEDGTQPLILVPKESLISRGQLVGIYAVSQSGNALLRWVKTGKSYDDKIEILSGLTHGEKYVAASDGKLFDGALVANK